jgi:hypothetical protein
LEAAEGTPAKSARSRTAAADKTANLIELDYTDVVTAQVLIEWNRPTTTEDGDMTSQSFEKEFPDGY